MKVRKEERSEKENESREKVGSILSWRRKEKGKQGIKEGKKEGNWHD